MKAWMKAGMVGGVLQIIFTLPSFAAIYLPLSIGGLLSTCACCLFFFLYPLPGILEVHWFKESRDEGKIIFAGALAGLLATVIDGFFTFLLMLIISVTGGMQAYLQSMMPVEMEMINQSGLGFFFSTTSILIQTGIGLIFHVVTGVALSAFGGLVYAGMKNK